MPVLYVHNGQLLVKNSKLAVDTGCCCDTGGGCTRNTNGCCCFGVGSVDGVDECDCVTMGGTWRSSCTDCQTLDGGNGGDGGDGSDDDPPPGYCNICRTLQAGFRTLEVEYGGCGAFTTSCNAGPTSDCTNYHPACTNAPRSLTFCNESWVTVGTSTGTLGCDCEWEFLGICEDPGCPIICANNDPCGMLHEAYQWSYFYLSSTKCKDSFGGLAMDMIYNTTGTVVNGPRPCTPTGNHYTLWAYNISQRMGIIANGQSISHSTLKKYKANMSGACTQAAQGSQITGPYTLTCTI